MAPFGLKLWENAFQTIPHITFFDAEYLFLDVYLGFVCRSQKIYTKLENSRFRGARIFLTSWAAAPRKMTPDEIIFRSLRHLAEG